MRFQRSISQRASCSGIGLHTGEKITLNFLPAPVNTGVVFIRRDINPPVFIKAQSQNVIATEWSTTLGVDSVFVRTVEHLLAAISGLDVDNLYVELNGSEIPIMDGSSSFFVSLLKNAGIVSQGIPRSFIKITRPIEVKEGKKRIRIEPSHSLKIDYSISYNHPFLGRQRFRYEHAEEYFCNEIADARTFCFLHEVEALWDKGIALGGSLDNAIVIGENGILNGTGLRYKDEFARHKVLDLIGDLFLVGLPVVGKIIAERAGHSLHTRFVEKLISKKSAWKIIEPVEKETRLFFPSVDEMASGRSSI